MLLLLEIALGQNGKGAVVVYSMWRVTMDISKQETQNNRTENSTRPSVCVDIKCLYTDTHKQRGLDPLVKRDSREHEFEFRDLWIGSGTRETKNVSFVPRELGHIF